MNKIIILKIVGDFSKGFDITASISVEGNIPHIEVTGKLPPNLTIRTSHEFWRTKYRSLDFRMRAKQRPGIKNLSSQEISEQIGICDESSKEVNSCLNKWLKSESFRSIREAFIKHVDILDEARILLCTDYYPLQQLQWNQWDLIEEYKKADIIFSSLEFKFQGKNKIPLLPGKVKILVILGSSEGIDIKYDEEILAQLPNTEITRLVEPERQEISDELWEQDWDILYFAGHSYSEQESGVIHINEHDSLHISDLKYALNKAIDRGLQLAIFNSCDGLGLLWDLDTIKVPQTIVMREPVPDAVAQVFLRYFLNSFTQGQSIHMAVKEARHRLHSSGLDNCYPGVSSLPVIYQNLGVVPTTWQELGCRPTEICPYRGLFSFKEEHSPFFFGREDFTEQLLGAIQDEALVTVIGPSGSGKSSIVFAGLVPSLRDFGKWKIISIRPSDRPFYSLSSALIPYLEPNIQERNEQLRVTRKLADDLQREPAILRDIVEKIIWDEPGSRLLLIIDQFEEIYTLSAKKDSQKFIACILECVEKANYTKGISHKSPLFNLLITLRADFLGQVLTSSDFAKVISSADQMIGPMCREELEQAIIQPAALFGVTIEPGLTRRIIDDILNDVSLEAGSLPLLQFALTQLWDKQINARLTHSAYDEIGGVRTALARHADEVYDLLNEEAKERTRRLFTQLVRPGKHGEPDTRRIVTRKNIGEHNWDLVMHLADVRLVTTSNHLALDSNRKLVEEETVEIVHEALIQEWSFLRTWLDLDRDFRIWQDGLVSTISQWKDSKSDNSYLLREGLSLSTAEEWLSKRPLEIGIDERVFIEKSLELRNSEIKKRIRRLKITIGGLSIGLLSVSIFAGVAVWFRQEAIEALENQINSLSHSSEVLRNSDQQFDALLTAMQATQPVVSERLRLQESTLNQVLNSLRGGIIEAREFNRFEGHSDEVWSVVFSPDGQIIATGSSDKTAKIWNVNGLEIATLEGHQGGITFVSISPDSQTIATTSFDKSVKLWNRNGQEIGDLEGHEDWVYGVRFSPDGETIATVSKDNSLRLWDRSGSLLKIFKMQPSDNSDGGLNSVAFNPDGKLVVASSWDKTVRMWNIETGQETIFNGHNSSVNSVNFSPSGREIISASSDGTLKLWNLNGQEIKTFTGHTAEVMSASFSPDGQKVVSSSFDKTVRFWNLDGIELKPSLTGHTAPIQHVAFSPDGESIATASFDSTVRIWSTSSQFREALKGHSDNVWGVTFNPNGNLVATASADGDIKIWDKGGNQILTFTAHEIGVTSVNFSPDGKLIATTGKDNLIKFWDLDGQEVSTFESHLAWVDSLSFSPDGQRFATSDWQGIMKIWSLKGDELLTLQAHNDLNKDSGRTYDVDFSPNGKFIATAGREGTAKIWDLSGNLITTLIGHSDQVYSSRFSPDGQTVITSSRDGTVKLWDLNGNLIKDFEVASAQVYSARFSPDGQIIATSSWDGIVKLWNLNGELIKTLIGHTEEVDNLSFSWDGRFLSSASRDDSVIIWDLNNLEIQENQNLYRLDLKELLIFSCSKVGNYLNYNPNVEDNDRLICDDTNI